MIKFSNEKSEALYYKLLDKYGKEEVKSGICGKRLRFPINPELGVSKTLFALAEFTEKEELFKYKKGKESRENFRDRIKRLDIEVSEISNFLYSNSYEQIAKEIFKEAKKEENRKTAEDQIKDQIGKLIKESGYLFAKKVLTNELTLLNEIIEKQQANLRKADEALNEAEEKKKQCLVLLYGTSKKEG